MSPFAKGGRDLLRCPSRGLWGNKLVVSASATHQQRSQVKIHGQVWRMPTVYLAAGRCSAEAELSFLRWLVQRAKGLSQLAIHYAQADDTWLFPQLLFAIATAQPSDKDWDLHLFAGDHCSSAWRWSPVQIFSVKSCCFVQHFADMRPGSSAISAQVSVVDLGS